MALVNHAKKEVNAKIIYYGPAGSGKSTALNYIYSRIKPALRGELKRVPAGGDNLLFFDFCPFEAPLSDGYRVRLHVYTLTGPVANPATWKMTLKGADGLVIMLDSSLANKSAALDSITSLRGYLSSYGVGLNDNPSVLLLNETGNGKCELDDAVLAQILDLPNASVCHSNTASGGGLLDSLGRLSKMVLERYGTRDKHDQPGGVGEQSADQMPTSATETKLPESASVPQISVMPCEARVDGTVVRIPLEIAVDGVSRRVVISVSVDTEQ